MGVDKLKAMFTCLFSDCWHVGSGSILDDSYVA